MSKAYNMGYEDALNEYSALKPERWHSEAHAQGWLYGLECLLANYAETPASDLADRDELIERAEGWIKETEKLIDQVTGSDDYKNTIQAMAREIERLNTEIERLCE